MFCDGASIFFFFVVFFFGFGLFGFRGRRLLFTPRAAEKTERRFPARAGGIEQKTESTNEQKGKAQK
jgi:hypothetical protein